MPLVALPCVKNLRERVSSGTTGEKGDCGVPAAVDGGPLQRALRPVDGAHSPPDPVSPAVARRRGERYRPRAARRVEKRCQPMDNHHNICFILYGGLGRSPSTWLVPPRVGLSSGRPRQGEPVARSLACHATRSGSDERRGPFSTRRRRRRRNPWGRMAESGEKCTRDSTAARASSARDWDTARRHKQRSHSFEARCKICHMS